MDSLKEKSSESTKESTNQVLESTNQVVEVLKTQK